jgi:hypothetical protein
VSVTERAAATLADDDDDGDGAITISPSTVSARLVFRPSTTLFV